MQANKADGELRRAMLQIIHRIETGEGGPHVPDGQPPAN